MTTELEKTEAELAEMRVGGYMADKDGEDALAIAESLLVEVKALRFALDRISKPTGPYKVDREAFLESIIEHSKQIALHALAGKVYL